MPKCKKDAVHRHFLYNEEDNCSQCIYCHSKLKGHHATNLKNHLAVKHKDKYNDVLNVNNQKENMSPSTSKIDKTEERIKLNCLKIVTIHGRPFQYLEDEAFQDILNVTLNKKAKPINVHNVKPMVADKAYEIRSKIASEVKGKLISLKLDSATYMYRSFMGINIQFYKNGKITVRTLATKEVFDSQTGEYLKQILEEVLIRYRIDISQIYSITTDNGKNYKKMSKLIGGSYDTIEGNENDSDGYESDEPNDGIEDIDLESAVETLTQSDELSFKPRTMLCAAHTLQLSIKDAIEANDYVKDVLSHVRHVAKILRTPTLRGLLKRANLKYPILDCPTRWSSTYEMLFRFKTFQSVCSENEDIREILNEESWQVIDDLITCLQPLYKATKRLQKEQLTLGDFFVEWMACKVSVGQCRSLFASSLSVSMTARQVSLLQTPLMLEALYLDTRLNIILTDNEASKARQYLLQTYEHMNAVKKLNNDVEEPTSLIEQSTTSDEQLEASSNHEQPGPSTARKEMGSTSAIIIEDILKRTELERGLERQRNINAIDFMLQEIRTLPRLSVNEDILTFWSTKLSSPEMAELALCVLSAPATQTSVERLFSALKFILSPARTNLSTSVLEDIMVIRSNKELFD